MSSIKPRCFCKCDEKLWSVGVRSGICHTQPAAGVMLKFEVLIWKSISVDTLSFKKDLIISWVLAFGKPLSPKTEMSCLKMNAITPLFYHVSIFIGQYLYKEIIFMMDAQRPIIKWTLIELLAYSYRSLCYFPVFIFSSSLTFLIWHPNMNPGSSYVSI